jgi:hypothetical protein
MNPSLPRAPVTLALFDPRRCGLPPFAHPRRTAVPALASPSAHRRFATVCPPRRRPPPLQPPQNEESRSRARRLPDNASIPHRRQNLAGTHRPLTPDIPGHEHRAGTAGAASPGAARPSSRLTTVRRPVFKRSPPHRRRYHATDAPVPLCVLPSCAETIDMARSAREGRESIAL